MSRPPAPKERRRATPILIAAVCLGLLMVVGCGEQARDRTRASKRTGMVRDPQPSCDSNATPSNFSSRGVGRQEWADRLSRGRHLRNVDGGTTKAITIRPQPGLRRRFCFDFGTNAANFTIDGGHTNYDTSSPGINARRRQLFRHGLEEHHARERRRLPATTRSFCLRGCAPTARDSHQGQHVPRHAVPERDVGRALASSATVRRPDHVHIVIEYNLFRDMGCRRD